MADHRSSEDIERGLAEDRAGLNDTLDDLRGKLSLDEVIRQATEQFREHGGDIGTSVSRAVKKNPMALALTGVGLAWLILGDKRDTTRQGSSGHADRPCAATQAPEQGGGPGTRASSTTTFGHQTVDEHQDDTPSWVRDVDHGDDTSHSSGAGALGGSDEQRGTLSNAAHSLRSGAQHASDAVGERTQAMRDRITHDTEQLSEEGRKRVIAARERAQEARSSAMAGARRGKDRSLDMFEEQPLIAGALALTVGVAIGAVLPRTGFEDEHFGAQSDELIHEAERILSEERAKIGAVGGAAMDEARDIARETKASVDEAAGRAKSEADRAATGETAAQEMADKGKQGIQNAGQRITDAAGKEADKRDLGKLRT